MIKRYPSSRHQRRARVRAKIFGTTKRPRLTVFRSNQHIYAQIIDDQAGHTLVAASDQSHISTSKNTKSDRALNVGTQLAKLAQKHKITKLTFDRGHYKYHGRVKALAEAAKKAGLEF